MHSTLADLEAFPKQEVKAKAEFSTAWLILLKACSSRHTEPLMKDWEVYWFQAFKVILNA